MPSFKFQKLRHLYLLWGLKLQMVATSEDRLPPYSFRILVVLFSFGSTSQSLDSIVFEWVETGFQIEIVMKRMMKCDICRNSQIQPKALRTCWIGFKTSC